MTSESVPAIVESEPVERVLELLRARGSRVTTSRRLLLRCLFDSDAHRSAEDLAAEVQAFAPDIHLSTIYRNLEELERLGVVVGVRLGQGPAIYHLATATHGHLVCEGCGATLEAAEDLFDALTRTARRRYGFVVDPRHLAMRGLCAACATSSTSPLPGATELA